MSFCFLISTMKIIPFFTDSKTHFLFNFTGCEIGMHGLKWWELFFLSGTYINGTLYNRKVSHTGFCELHEIIYTLHIHTEGKVYTK